MSANYLIIKNHMGPIWNISKTSSDLCIYNSLKERVSREIDSAIYNILVKMLKVMLEVYNQSIQ